MALHPAKPVIDHPERQEDIFRIKHHKKGAWVALRKNKVEHFYSPLPPKKEPTNKKTDIKKGEAKFAV